VQTRGTKSILKVSLLIIAMAKGDPTKRGYLIISNCLEKGIFPNKYIF